MSSKDMKTRKIHMRVSPEMNQILQISCHNKFLLGNRFKFYYYGNGKDGEPLIYENDYPLNCYGCCGTGCAHYSKCCTVL